MRALRVVSVVLLGGPLLALALVCLFGALGGQLGQISLEWDVLTHFAPIWLVCASLVGAAGFLLTGGVRLAVVSISAIAVLSAVCLIAPELGRSTGPRGTDGPQAITLIQLNIWRSGEIDQTVEWLAGQRADVIVLQETYPAFREALLRRTGWHAICSRCETMIVSPHAPISEGPGQQADWSPGPLARAQFAHPAGPYTVIGIHHSWPTEIDTHQAQQAQLVEAAAVGEPARTIVSGDFNSTPWSFSHRQWDEVIGLIRRDKAVSTWPARTSRRAPWAGVPFLPIDHVYAGEGWATVSVRRGPRLGSDHYPLIVRLSPVKP